jgi:3-dehydroquinate dehydratase-1
MLSFDGFTLLAAIADLSDAETEVAREHADAAEFRMDLAERPLEGLADYDGALPLVVTNRAAWEGGETDDDAARLDALETAVGNDRVGAVDIELASLTEGDGERVVEAARGNDAAVVVSTHDFEATPPRASMVETLETAAEHGDVGKLAVTAADRSDTLDVLAATHACAEAGVPVATMAMGEAGRHTRAVSPLYGSKIGYAPVYPAAATAPGQYDLATLSGLVEALQ